ncbi:fatty-acid amide hydrolase 2-B [Parasteatoda tepidariorum]|uniref:fatty-acid amide hydrolase 2-B n=1 Tax=Parasteatoda tepidariorum TaxID=114398 RepID=UPI001C722456|nr:fatty-acid amide hydrolase 2-B [Parasteatoda tepidariorum]
MAVLVRNKFAAYAIRFFRRIIELISRFFLILKHCGRRKKLADITDPVLLESATSLANKIRTGEVKSSDVIKSYISRIQAVQPLINAYVDERFEEAFEDAKKVDELVSSGLKTVEEMERDTPFLGVPFSAKEAVSVKGLFATGGAVFRKGAKAEADCDVVQLFREAGAIPLVVTNTSEMCLWWETYNKLHGKTKNPYDTTRTPGGSSGGESSLLTAAASVIGIGTDLGGSIRIPALFSGIFGHKPSRGAVSNGNQYPVVKEAVRQMIGTGPMCRYAIDLLPMMKIMTSDKKDLLKLDDPVNVKKLRVFYMEDDGGYPFRTPVSRGIKKALRKAVNHFEDICEQAPQKIFKEKLQDAVETWVCVIETLNDQQLCNEIVGYQKKLNLSKEVLKSMAGKSKHTFPIICLAILDRYIRKYDSKLAEPFFKMRDELLQEFNELLGDDGIFLYPTYPVTAPYHMEMLFRPFNIGYSVIFNILGLPVTQCPLGMSSKGLPLGIQVIGGMNRDSLTIAAARELEKAFGGWISPCDIRKSSIKLTEIV